VCPGTPQILKNQKNNKGNSMTQKASIKRIVHYMKYGTPGGEHPMEASPAMITKVLDDSTQECALFVMNPNGCYFNPTKFSEDPKPGHWSWPPRV